MGSETAAGKVTKDLMESTGILLPGIWLVT